MRHYKPDFNSYYGECKLIARSYKIKKPIRGWWKTLRILDEDLRDTLEIGTAVDVFYSEKQDCYILGRVEVKENISERPITFEAFIKN